MNGPHKLVIRRTDTEDEWAFEMPADATAAMLRVMDELNRVGESRQHVYGYSGPAIEIRKFSPSEKQLVSSQVEREFWGLHEFKEASDTPNCWQCGWGPNDPVHQKSEKGVGE